MDKITIDRIKESHPLIREKLLSDYLEANSKLGKGARLRFADVYRSEDQQRMLYRKRPKVTNSDAWQSIHNYGLAFDIVLLYDNDGDGKFEEISYNLKRDFDEDKKADWMEVVDFFKSKGWNWGGDWRSFKDSPHFEANFSENWRIYRGRLLAGKFKRETVNAKSIKYVEINLPENWLQL